MKTIASIGIMFAATTLAHANLVAHYDFDTVGDNAGTPFTNEVTTSGTNFANGGSRAEFDQDCRRLGTGSLVVKNRGGVDSSGNDGAVSNTSFDWSASGYNSDVRTVAFWVKATSSQSDTNPTMISLGSGTAQGNRFDIRLSGGALRLEVQSGGFTTGSVLNDNAWHHVALVVPNATSTLADVKYYIDGALTGNLAGTAPINTGTGPLRMGDSFQDTTRDFDGALDDVRLYNEALGDAAVTALYNDGVANIPGILCFDGSSASILSGESVVLTYEIDPAASSANIDNGVGAVSGAGTVSVSPTNTTTYTLTVVHGAGTVQQTFMVNVAPPELPPFVNYMHTVPTILRDGGTVTVHWSTVDANLVTLNDGTGPITVTGTGSHQFTVSADTTFTLSAENTNITDGPVFETNSVDVRSGADPVSYEETILADSPLAYYRFEEPAYCTSLFDHSPNLKDSTQIIGNISFQEPGAIGSAARFHNTEAVVLGLSFNPQDPDGDDTAGDVDPNGIEAWSVEMLVRPDFAAPAGRTSSQVLVSNRDGSGAGRSDLMIEGVSGTVGSFLGNSSQSTATTLFDDAWSHLVMTVTYNAGTSDYTARYYLDGALIDTITGLNVESATGAWVLGSHKLQQLGSFLVGLMDEVSFYGYALDDPNGDGNSADSKIAAHFAAYIHDGAPLLSAGTRTPVIHLGSNGTLQVIVGNSAQTVTIDNGVGTVVPVNGVATVAVSPGVSTTYTITVSDGSNDYVITVDVAIVGPVTLTVDGFVSPGVFQTTAGNLIPGKTYHLDFGSDLATLVSSPVQVVSFVADTTAEVIQDLFAPAGKGFYRLAEEP